MKPARRPPTWRAAAYAGLIAAVVSLVVETPIFWFVADQPPWVAARMAAAMVLGPEVLSPPAAFDVSLVAVATMVHLALSVLYGLVFACIVPGKSALAAAGFGLCFGLALYLINMHGIAPVLFPWFRALRGGVTILSHAVFGAALGASYAALRRRRAD